MEREQNRRRKGNFPSDTQPGVRRKKLRDKTNLGNMHTMNRTHVPRRKLKAHKKQQQKNEAQRVKKPRTISRTPISSMTRDKI